MKAISSTSVPWILSVLFGGAMVVCLAGHGTWHWTLWLGYHTTAERSDGRLVSLWNICNTNLRTRPSIFGSWGERSGCPTRTRVQCPVNHPSITSQESVRISAWLFPVHHVPFQCSYQDLGGFGIKERRMLKDQLFEENLERKRRDGKVNCS